MANNEFDLIIKNSDIVDIISSYLPLKQKGKNFWGVCPFHDDTEPSMSVSQEKGLFKCFACQVGGSVAAFLMKINKWSFNQAIKHLAQAQGISIQLKDDQYTTIKYSEYEEKLIHALDDAMNIFSYLLFDSKDTMLIKYLQKRSLDQKLIKKFSIGFSSKIYLDILRKKGHSEDILINASLATFENRPFFNDRLLFAIKNLQGDVVGFSGRSLNPEVKSTKYINSSEYSLFKKTELLYNYSEAKSAIEYNKEVIIVEGFMDVIAYFRDGIENVVAIMGTALTEQHLKLISGYKVILSLDEDKAGVIAATKSLILLIKNKINCWIVQKRNGLDPDEFLAQNGIGSLQNNLNENQISGIEFLFQKYKTNLDINNFESVQNFKHNFVSLLHYLEPEKRNFYVEKVDRELNIKINSQTSLSANYNSSDKQLRIIENDSPINFPSSSNKENLQNYLTIPNIDPLAEIKKKQPVFMSMRDDNLEEIIVMIFKNPKLLHYIKIDEIPIMDLDTRTVIDHLFKQEVLKKNVPLTPKQQLTKAKYEALAKKVNYIASIEVEDFNIKLRNLKSLILKIIIDSDLIFYKENEEDKEISENLQNNIEKQNKKNRENE